MQTFLPYFSFEKSAKVLDKKRCFKQLVEAKQILCVLHADIIPTDWKLSKDYLFQKSFNHPTIQMWLGYGETLVDYYNDFLLICKVKHKINTTLPALDMKIICPDIPWWLGNENFHRSHRTRLIAKDREFYLPLFPEDENYNDGKYWWPDNKTKTFKIIKYEFF